MKILALDISSKSTGYAVFDNNELIDYGIIKSASKDTIKRMKIMKDGVSELLNKYDIDVFIAEDVPGGKKSAGNIRTTQVLFNLQGIILMTVYEFKNDIQLNFIQASSWRSTIGIKTGKGKKREELKEEDKKFVKEKFNIETDSDDIADAICIGYSHIVSNEKIVFKKGD